MLVDRTKYLGGTSASTILGKNRYQTRYDLWNEKVNGTKLDLADNPHVQRGNLVEPIIEEFVRENLDPTVNSVASWEKYADGTPDSTGQMFVMDDQPSPVHGLPFIGGHPDGVGEEILWEFKAPTSYKLDKIIKEGPPDSWYYQVQHYMMITKQEQGALAIWSYDRWEPYIIWIDPDPFIHALLRDEYARFWEYVEKGEPLPTEGVTTMEKEQHEVIDDPKLERLLQDYHQAYCKRYEGKEEQNAARLALLSAVGTRKTVITPGYTADIAERKMYGKMVTVLTVKETGK